MIALVFYDLKYHVGVRKINVGLKWEATKGLYNLNLLFNANFPSYSLDIELKRLSRF